MSATYIFKGKAHTITTTGLLKFSEHSVLRTALDHACIAQESSVPIELSDNLPLDPATFGRIIAWANDGLLSEIDANARCWADTFAAANFLHAPELASICLSMGPPPSMYDPENQELHDVEATYMLKVGRHTFIQRRPAVGGVLPHAAGNPVLTPPERWPDRAEAPLFNEPGALPAKIDDLLLPEARACLDAGLVLAGGFLGRTAAHLAGLCDAPAGGKCDIDFYPLGSTDEALATVRRALIALGKVCEQKQNGMFVCRSQYAITIGMDDCLYDIQIVLCTFSSMQSILENFDVDMCRFAFDGREIIASETAVRAACYGMVVAEPWYDSGKRLAKYNETVGVAIIINKFDAADPGFTPSLLLSRHQERPLEPPPPAAIVDEAPGQLEERAFRVAPIGEIEVRTFEQDWRNWRCSNPLLQTPEHSPDPPRWESRSITDPPPYEVPPVAQPMLCRQVQAYDAQARHYVEVWRDLRRKGQTQGTRFADVGDEVRLMYDSAHDSSNGWRLGGDKEFNPIVAQLHEGVALRYPTGPPPLNMPRRQGANTRDSIAKEAHCHHPFSSSTPSTHQQTAQQTPHGPLHLPRIRAGGVPAARRAPGTRRVEPRAAPPPRRRDRARAARIPRHDRGREARAAAGGTGEAAALPVRAHHRELQHLRETSARGASRRQLVAQPARPLNRSGTFVRPHTVHAATVHTGTPCTLTFHRPAALSLVGRTRSRARCSLLAHKRKRARHRRPDAPPHPMEVGRTRPDVSTCLQT